MSNVVILSVIGVVAILGIAGVIIYGSLAFKHAEDSEAGEATHPPVKH